MRSRLIEVGAVVLQDANQLEPADHQHVIQTFSPQTAHKSFTNRISVRVNVKQAHLFIENGPTQGM
jgi:hypothetical protein